MVKISNGANFSTGHNMALQNREHPLPVLDDIFARPMDNQAFSKLDLDDDYLQLEVDDSFKYLLTIDTPLH